MLARHLATLLIGLSLLAAPLAWAGDDDDDDRERDAADASKSRDADADADLEEDSKDDERRAKAFDDVKRDVDVHVGDREVVVKYESESADYEDELKFTYHADEGDIKLSYENKSDASETEHTLKVRVIELLEYADANANGAYDPDVDRVASSHRVDDLDWSVGNVTNVTLGDVPGKRFEGAAALGDAGHLILRFTAAGDYADAGDVVIRPTDLKFDVVIVDYPYAENGTALALLTETKQESEFEVEDGDGESGVEATAAGYRFYFKWAESASVDGATHAVGSTVVKDENETEDGESEHKRIVYLNYARGSVIEHDPVVGVAAGSAAATNDAPTTSGGDATGAAPTGSDGAPATGAGGGTPPASNSTPAAGVAVVAAAALAAAGLARGGAGRGRQGR